MQHSTSLEDLDLSSCWLTIGSFDGVHLGHQAILRQMVERAHAARSQAVVITFFPHPSVVLRNRQEAFYLTSPDERANLLGDLGIDRVITLDFTAELARMSAYDFMSMISQKLRPQQFWVGYDFALGRNRVGNVDRLTELGKIFKYKLKVVYPIQLEGETVSSSQIRTALTLGEIEKANRLLGREYRMEGLVVHGDGRGQLIGIPTANLAIWRWRVMPKSGVYACKAHIDGHVWAAVTNVGVRPTFENQPVSPRVETHVLDLKRDLYGRPVAVDFLYRLRDEQRFSSVDELVAQIKTDIQQTRDRFFD